MIVTLEQLNGINRMIFCSFSVSWDYTVMAGDDYFYNYIGKTGCISLKEIVCPDYFSEFEEVFKTIKKGEECRVISFFKGKKGYIDTVDVFITHNGGTVDNIPVLDFKVNNIDTVEEKFIQYSNNLYKYRTLLSLYNDYYFDYDYEKDILTVFAYRNIKPTMFLQCGYNEFEEKARSYIKDDKSKERLEYFCQYLKSGVGDYSFEIKWPVIGDVKKYAYFNIECKTIFKHNREKLVVGVIRRNDNTEYNEIPLYKRPEGKDSFTGVASKRACTEYIKSVLKTDKSKHYMIVTDADRFKQINDRLGHSQGDRVILYMAETLTAVLNGRGIVGRFGGDEFLIFTNGIANDEKVKSLITHIGQKISGFCEGEFEQNKITLSMGVSCYPEDGNTYEELFEKADKCLYIAKENGRNRYVFYDESKHGDVNIVNAFRTDIDKNTDCAGVAADVGEIIFSGEPDAVNHALEYIREKMNVEGIRIYSVGSDAPVYCRGEYKEDAFVGKSLEKTFVPEMDGKCFLAYNDASDFYRVDANMCDVFEMCGIKAFAVYRLENKKGDVYYMFFDLINYNLTWSEEEKGCYFVISKMLGKII